MTDAREQVLSRVRAALGKQGGQQLQHRRPGQPVPRDYRRTGDHPPGHPALLELLTERLVDYRATVVRATVGAAEPVETVETVDAADAADAVDADDAVDPVVAVVAETVAATLPPGGRLVVPPGLPAGWAPPGATVDDGLTIAEVEAFDGVLTGCAAAVAETGTIVLDASAGQGRRLLTLLPDRHICVVRADQVVHGVPELLGRLDPRRPLTFVSGPSATSDIELSRVEGVHGPRTLVVVLVRRTDAEPG